MRTRRLSRAVQLLQTLDVIQNFNDYRAFVENLDYDSARHLDKLAGNSAVKANLSSFEFLCKHVVQKHKTLSREIFILAVILRKERLVYGLLDAGQTAAPTAGDNSW